MIFIIGLAATYISGAFLKGILKFIWAQTLNLLKTAWSIIFNMLKKTYRCIKDVFLSIYWKIKDKFVKPEPLKKKKLVRNVSKIENGIEEDSFICTSESHGNAMSTREKEMIEKMENDIQDE